MKANMATRNVGSTNLIGCTDFVLHSIHRTSSIEKNKILDYSEFKLLKYLNSIHDNQQRTAIEAMIVSYKLGEIAIAWKKGNPLYIKVTKDT